MRRTGLILISGIAVALAAYFGFYLVSGARNGSLEQAPEPELAWLKREFRLSDAEFTRISQMHDSYLEGCAERCRKIDLKNQELRELLTSTNTLTPEIERKIAEAAQLRADCQKIMLQHFYDVSRTMPPEQGKRYLAWVQEQTVLSDNHRGMHH